MNDVRKRLSAWSASALLTFIPSLAFGDLIYSEDASLTSSPGWSENVTINEGSSVALGTDVLPGQTANITVNIFGSLSFDTTKTSNHASENSLVTANNRSIAFTGTGTLVKTGSGSLATQSGNWKNDDGYSVKFALSDGALIDIQNGTFRNGGYQTQNWSENKADLRLASGAQADVWDGSNMQFDSLVGAGSFIKGQVKATAITIGAANSTWLVDGVQTTPEFSGNFSTGSFSLTKIGSGTQILSGNYLSTGTITVSAGTLQIGNGTTGFIDTKANVSVAKDAVLVFNTEKSIELAKELNGEGIVNLQKGTLLIGKNNFKGTISTAAGTTLGLAAKSSAETSIAAGTNLMLNVNENDAAAFSVKDFNSYRTQGASEGFTVGVYTPFGVSASQSIDGDFLSVNSDLQKVGGGVLALTGVNSSFTSKISVADGALAFGNGTKSASLSSDAVISVDAGTQFIFDNGAESSTVVSNKISGSGELVIASGTVRYSENSPIFYSETHSTYGDGAARIDLPQVTVKNGAKLVFEDGVTPTFNKKNGTFTIESGGIMELAGNSRGENHYWNNSANIFSGELTVNGAGTLLKTGSKAIALLCRQNGYNGTVAMAMSEGGWIDVQEGQLLSGGWSGNIDWTSNKSSLNVADGAKFNMWDGISSSNVYVDSLTGSGTLERGHIHLGVANNVASEKYGVADNTAIFSGKITGDKAAVSKTGTGTQVFTGDNTYAGNTTVSDGVLQIGNGGNTGKIGTGTAIVNGNGILRFNTSQTNAVAEFQGSGTVQAENSGKVVANALTGFTGTLNPVSQSDVIEFNIAENKSGTLSAKVVGNGTVSLVMQNGASADMRMGSVADSATLAVSGGTLTIDGNDFRGTLQAVNDSTLNIASTVSYQVNPWDMNYYGSAMRLTPNSSDAPTIAYGGVYDMSQGANAPTHKQTAQIMLGNNSTLSYRTFIEVTDDLSLDFAGCFDDSQGVWAIPCDADGNVLSGESWRTLLGYSNNCAVNSVTGVNLSAGYYLIDVRVTDDLGNRYATGSVKDADGNALGIGMRINGAANYSAMDINQETSALNGSDGKIFAGKASVSGEQVWNNAKMNIAENATLTIDNSSADVSAVTLENAQITGKGTLALAASGNDQTRFAMTGLDAKGSVSVGENIAAKLAGNIDGDLILQDNVSLDFDIDTADGNAPILTVGGEIDLSGIFLNINATGEAPEDGEYSTWILIDAKENAITGFDLQNINWNILDENLRLTADVVNGALTVTAGNSATLPEPASIVMMILGIGFFVGAPVARKLKAR